LLTFLEIVPLKLCPKECWQKLEGKGALDKKMNFAGWTYLFTFGSSLDIYAKGKERVRIDRKTGEVINK